MQKDVLRRREQRLRLEASCREQSEKAGESNWTRHGAMSITALVAILPAGNCHFFFFCFVAGGW